MQGTLSECITIRNDIRHGAAVTHIIALDRVVTGASLAMRGNIFCGEQYSYLHVQKIQM
jgi:hypothetical protein